MPVQVNLLNSIIRFKNKKKKPWAPMVVEQSNSSELVQRERKGPGSKQRVAYIFRQQTYAFDCGINSFEKFEYEKGENRFASKAIEWSTPVTDEVESINLVRKKTSYVCLQCKNSHNH